MTGRRVGLAGLGLVLANGIVTLAEAQTPAGVPRLHFAGLQHDVHPQPDGLSGHRWVVRLPLMTTGEDGQTVLLSPTDLPVQLSSSRGELSSSRVVIPQGQTQPAEPIDLTSNEEGEVEIYAWPEVQGGTLETVKIVLHLPRPTRLQLQVKPERGLSIGKVAALTVTVQLQDEESSSPAADHDTTVTLTSAATLDQTSLRIAKGESSANTQLSATSAGRVEVTASAPDLQPDQASAEFVFPTRLLFLAALGGVIGSVYRSTWHASQRGWRFVMGAVPGSVPGVFAYGLAAFVPGLPAPLSLLPPLPATSSLGALVIGLFGGYCGRRLFQACAGRRKPPSASA
jgi:hypothetical protein